MVSLTQYAYYYFCNNLFENAGLEDGKNEEEWKKTTRSDTEFFLSLLWLI